MNSPSGGTAIIRAMAVLTHADFTMKSGVKLSSGWLTHAGFVLAGIKICSLKTQSLRDINIDTKNSKHMYYHKYRKFGYYWIIIKFFTFTNFYQIII
jgi:hypothetical protein